MTRDTVKNILNEINLPFKESRAGLNFKCPICGDSKTSQRKRRGWLLFKDDRVNYFCHNCSISLSFSNFLKENHKDVYFKYFSELSKRKIDDKIEATKVNEIITGEELIHEDLKYILDAAAIPLFSVPESSKLREEQLKAVKYLIKRKIPKDKIKECYLGIDNYINPETKEVLRLNHRIIIPYRCKDKIYAFQGRTLLDSEYVPKYLTIKGKNDIKIYNFFDVDKNKRVYVTEGPIDSWFLNNAISVSGSVSEHGPVIELINRTFEDVVFVFDNDLAGEEKTIKYLKEGFKCFKWEYDWRECKDINDVVKTFCLTNDTICDIINNNVIEGFKGLVDFKMK